MRTAMVSLVVVLGASVTGCADFPSRDTGKDEPSLPAAQASVRCSGVEKTPERITAAQAALAPGKDPAAGRAAADLVLEDLDTLRDGAPADVRDVLDDLGKALEDAVAALDDPSSQPSSEADKLAEEIAQDGRRISAYVVAHCS